MKPIAVITGVGQDTHYLGKLLLDKDYKVYIIHRRSTNRNWENIQEFIDHPNLHLICGDITDGAFISTVIQSLKPNEFYNLAAQSFVQHSFTSPFNVFDVDTVGVLNILEAIKNLSPSTKLFQASSSEQFGKSCSLYYKVYDQEVRWDGIVGKIPKTIWDARTTDPFQDENTPFIPQSPYGIAKTAAFQLCRLYRESYSLFVCSNIMWNHESRFRGKEFITRKISWYISQLVNNKTKYKLQIGNILAKRDWSFAGDFMESAWLSLQHPVAQDYGICSGLTHSVEELLEYAFTTQNLNWKDYVEYNNPSDLRPAEVDYLKGRSDLAKNTLNWSPKMSFEELITDMINTDIARNK